MEPIVTKQQVAKRQIYTATVPVIGIESAQESASAEIEGDGKLSRVAVLAYYKAEARGYEPGHEMQDWLDAEAEIMEKIKKEKIK